MTFLGSLARRSLENPGIPITSDAIRHLFTDRPTSSGMLVSPESSLRVGAALRGMSIIAASVAGCPLKVYRDATRDEVRVPAINGHNEHQTSFERWETVIGHMAGWGAGVLFKNREESGRVRQLTIVHPRRVTVECVDELNIASGPVRRFIIDGKPFTSYEILYIPMLSLDAITGIGPIGYARETFGIALSAEQAAAKRFANGLMLDGFITTDADLTKKQATALKRKWSRTMGGSQHAGEIGVLDSGATFNPLSMPLKDAQFIEQRKFQVTEIARLLGVPGWMLNDQEKSTSWGTGMETMWANFITTTLKPYMQRIEQRIQHELLPQSGSQYAEFKVEGLLRGDSKARAAFYNAGITGGWLVPNEPRNWENLEPVEWGDEPYLPHNTSADAQTSDPTDDTEE